MKGTAALLIINMLLITVSTGYERNWRTIENEVTEEDPRTADKEVVVEDVPDFPDIDIIIEFPRVKRQVANETAPATGATGGREFYDLTAEYSNLTYSRRPSQPRRVYKL